MMLLVSSLDSEWLGKFGLTRFGKFVSKSKAVNLGSLARQTLSPKADKIRN